MFEFIKKWFSSVVYIQIWSNRIKVLNCETKLVFDEEPLIAIKDNGKGKKIIVAIGNSAKSYRHDPLAEVSNPFLHPRMLFNDFVSAEKIIQYAIMQVYKSRFKPSPKVIMHPREKLDGGINYIEVRAFKEMAYGAGALEVVVYTGAELSMYNLNFKELADS